MKMPWTEILFCLIVFLVGLLIPVSVAVGGIWEIYGFRAHSATYLALLSQLLAPILGVIYYIITKGKLVEVKEEG